MNDFFSEELKIADEKACTARWSCGKNGEYFRCGFCGYKLIVGDKYRIVYTNDIKGAYGNPIVCEKCNDTTQKLRDKWKRKHDKWNKICEMEYWWFVKHLEI